jgi:hypothetical protein
MKTVEIFEKILQYEDIYVLSKFGDYRDASSNISEIIAEVLKIAYPSADIFVAGNENPRPSNSLWAGKITELLFDINVIEVEVLEKSHAGNKIAKAPIVSRSLWAIEIELAMDTRHWATDFAKLVLSNAENKLFVAPKFDNVDNQLETFKKLSKYCTGQQYLYLLDEDVYKNKSIAREIMSLKGTIYQKKDDNWKPICKRH